MTGLQRNSTLPPAFTKDSQRYNLAALCQSLLLLRDHQLSLLRCTEVNQLNEEWALKWISSILRYLNFVESEKQMIEGLRDVMLPTATDINRFVREIVSSLAETFPDQDENKENEDITISKVDVIRRLSFDLTLLALSTGDYDARTRNFIRTLLALFDWTEFVHEEFKQLEIACVQLLQDSLRNSEKKEETDLLRCEKSNSEALERRALAHRRRNYVFLGLAALSGGLALGLTGGLVAPLVGAGMSGALTAFGIGGTSAFLGSIGGTALITSLFGVTGAGLSTFRMARRTRGIKEFRFLNQSSPDEQMAENTVAEVSSKRSIRSFFFQKKNNDDPESTPLEDHSAHSEDVLLGERSETVQEDCGNDCSSTRKSRETTKQTVRPPSVLITISGWVKGASDFTETWSCLLKPNSNQHVDAVRAFPFGEHYSLVWETDALTSVSSAFEMLLLTETVSWAAVTALQTTVMAALMSAMFWPASLLSVASTIDNPWSVALDRARKAGLVLADVLSERRQGHRPVSLYGSSLGARVIWFALQELYRRRHVDMVDEVVLLGAPVATSPDDWNKLRCVVAGRLVNGYSTRDWLLGFLFRSFAVGFTVAGLGPKEKRKSESDIQALEMNALIYNPLFFPFSATHCGPTDGVEHIDLTEIISGHSSYQDPECIALCLSKCGIV